MKTHTLKLLGASSLLLVTIAVSAQTLDMSKEQFLDMYINVLKQSDEVKSQTRSIMRKSLGDEKFAKVEADSAQGKAQMAKCMGVSTDKIELYINDTDHQIKSVRQCSSTLPDTISNVSFVNPANSPGMELFSGCIARKAADKIGVTPEKILQCSHQDD